MNLSAALDTVGTSPLAAVGNADVSKGSDPVGEEQLLDAADMSFVLPQLNMATGREIPFDEAASRKFFRLPNLVKYRSR